MDWRCMAAKLVGIEHWAQMSDAKRWEVSHNMAAARIARNERRAKDLEARVADLGGRMCRELQVQQLAPFLGLQVAAAVLPQGSPSELPTWYVNLCVHSPLGLTTSLAHE